MANPEHIAKLKEGADAWNHWRASQRITPDLSGVDLSGTDPTLADLRGIDFRDINFSGANLSGSVFFNKDLSRANLVGADLNGAGFTQSNLSGASLRETNLQRVDLSVAHRGLQTEQLAGADLTGAKLPDELQKLYEKLDNVNNISESARKLFLVVLGACLYSWLTIATTTDLNLIINRASSPLPIIQTSIPIVGFYVVAPLLVLCVYFYFHFYLQKLWEELGSLPGIFPDGRALHTRIDPWLLNDLIRAHFPKLNVNRPFLSYFQLWVSVLLAWWVVPITLFLFWGRYLPRHDRIWTTFHVVLFTISTTAALCLYKLAVSTLRGVERKPFRWRGMLTSRRGYQTAAFAAAVGMLFAVVSWGARWGRPSYLTTPLHQSLPDRLKESVLIGVPRLVALVGYSSFANLTNAEVSQKKSTWTRNDKNLDSVVGAQSKGANLRYAQARGAFFAGADLNGADLSGANLGDADLNGADLSLADLNGANLSRAQLHYANLSGAHLRAGLSGATLSGAQLGGADLNGAYLIRADLNGAYLNDANLFQADLTEADLTYSEFQAAENLNLDMVKRAKNYDKAFFDNDILKALGLPADHNIKLAAQWKKEKKEQELQQKQNAAKAAPNPSQPKQ